MDAISRAPAPPRGALHLKHVEGMRAAAALVVFVNHAYAQVWRSDSGEAAEGMLSAFSYFMVAGHLSVTVFIVISGFCLALPVVRAGDRLRGGTASFFRRRARRILPPYYGAVALSLGLIATVLGKETGTIWDVPIMVTRESIVSHVLLLQNLFGTGSINYVFWSIAVEWQIYFLFPLLVWAWRKVGPAATLATTLIVGYGLREAFEDTRIARAHAHFVGMFVLGMLAAYVCTSPRPGYVRARDKFPWAAVGALALVLACALVFSWGIRGSTDRFHLLDAPVGVLATCLLVLASRSERGLAARVFSWKPLAFVGTFSYSVYLLHAPLLQLLWQYVLSPAGVAPNMMFAFLMTAGLLVVLGASYLFFRLLEEPFMGGQERRMPAAVPAR